MNKFYPDPPSIGDQIGDLIFAKKQMDDYEAQLKLKWEAGNKKDEKKEDKKGGWDWQKIWLTLGVLSLISVPLQALLIANLLLDMAEKLSKLPVK